MKLSIVATLYQSAHYIDEFYKRSSTACRTLVGNDYEIILVNDGSPDDSLERAISLTQLDENVKVIDLSRNFGHHKAMMTGLSHAKGEKVLLIDSDLEESPEWLTDFLHLMQSTESDVVYGVQTARKGKFFERVSGNIFYSFINKLTSHNLPKNITTARLMSRRYVAALLEHKDKEVFLAGLWHITGFKQTSMPVNKLNTSQTTYTLRKRASILINSVTSFSSAPLKAIFYIGVLISCCALFYIIYLIISKLFFASPLNGWTSLMASIWLIGGLIILFIGVIGIYLAKIFSETKDRPYTIVREIHAKEK